MRPHLQDKGNDKSAHHNNTITNNNNRDIHMNIKKDNRNNDNNSNHNNTTSNNHILSNKLPKHMKNIFIFLPKPYKIIWNLYKIIENQCFNIGFNI